MKHPHKPLTPTRPRTRGLQPVQQLVLTLALGGLLGYTLRGCQTPTPNPTQPETRPAATTTAPTTAVEVAILWEHGFTRKEELDVFPMQPDPYDQYDGLVVENPTDRTLHAYAQLVFYHGATPVAVRLERPVTIPPRTLTELRFDSVGRTPRPTHALLVLRPAPPKR